MYWVGKKSLCMYPNRCCWPAPFKAASCALQMEGVVGYFDHTSVPAHNDIGAVIHDEEVFASDKVTCIGAPCFSAICIAPVNAFRFLGEWASHEGGCAPGAFLQAPTMMTLTAHQGSAKLQGCSGQGAPPDLVGCFMGPIGCPGPWPLQGSPTLMRSKRRCLRSLLTGLRHLRAREQGKSYQRDFIIPIAACRPRYRHHRGGDRGCRTGCSPRSGGDLSGHRACAQHRSGH